MIEATHHKRAAVHISDCGRVSDRDRLILLSQVPAAVERRTGVRPSRSAVFRWVQRGCKGARLRTLHVGGHRRTCDRWIWEFFEATTIAADGKDLTSVAQASGPTKSARRLHEEAERVLNEAGI